MKQHIRVDGFPGWTVRTHTGCRLLTNMSERTPISVIVLTYNESVNIRKCLEHLEWADDVVSVDSGSTDDTLALAKTVRPGIRIFSHAFVDFGEQRNWAIQNTSPCHEWILFVDADEFVPAELAEEIGQLIRSSNGIVGGYIAGRNFFLGRWLKHCTYFPSYQLRLLKKGRVTFRKEGHGQREITAGPLTYLKASWRHEGFSKGVAEWIQRHNRYSTEEAELLQSLRMVRLSLTDCCSRDPMVRRRALKRLGARLPCRPLVRFLYTYIWRRGFLDGRAGFLFCLLQMSYDIQIAAKLAEKRHS